jgi:hypothetical protein
MGLYHTFQGGCAGGDRVDDTPAQAVQTSGCPSDPIDSCPGGGPDPVNNYMDYSDDACLTEFTAGQKDRMDAMWKLFRSGSVPVNPTIELVPTEPPSLRPSHAPVKAAPAPAPTSASHILLVKFGVPKQENVNVRHLVEEESLGDNECTDEDYDMYLVVAQGAHFAGLATPQHGGSGLNCPSLVFHAQALGRAHLTKAAHHVDADQVAALEEGHKLYLGIRTLGQIVEAYEAAPVSKDGALYDAISNNCVVLLRNMADRLDLVVDARIVAFVTRHLTGRASAHVVDLMKASPALHSLYQGGRRLWSGSDNTEDLIAKVVQLYV